MLKQRCSYRKDIKTHNKLKNRKMKKKKRTKVCNLTQPIKN